MAEIVLPNGQPAKTDMRPKGLRCGLCGRRPQLAATVNPRSIQELGNPAAGDEVGGVFLMLATCTECFMAVQAVLRAATGILRPETDLAPLMRVEAAPTTTAPSSPTPA